MATVISAGAVAGLTTVVLTLMIGGSRVIFAMSRDHLLPAGLAKVHPTFRTPWVITAVVTVVVALVAGPDARRGARGDGQHRHPERVRAGQPRRAGPAAQAPRPAALVPGAVGAGAAAAVRARSACT